VRQSRLHVEPGLVARGIGEQCAPAEIGDTIGRRFFLHDVSFGARPRVDTAGSWPEPLPHRLRPRL
jgi:hypothetical protein